jgi:hypothetical protein
MALQTSFNDPRQQFVNSWTIISTALSHSSDRSQRLRHSSFDPAKYATNGKDVKQDGDQRGGDLSTKTLSSAGSDNRDTRTTKKTIPRSASTPRPQPRLSGADIGRTTAFCGTRVSRLSMPTMRRVSCLLQKNCGRSRRRKNAYHPAGMVGDCPVSDGREAAGADDSGIEQRECSACISFRGELWNRAIQD